MNEYQIINRRLNDACIGKRGAKQIAEAIHAELRNIAADFGQNPDSEVFIRKPGEPRHFDDTSSYCVCWEAGPYEWAIGYSLSDRVPGLIEPYYSFDLCIYPNETYNGKAA